MPRRRAALQARSTPKVSSDDLKTLADLNSPSPARPILRDNYPFGLFAVPRSPGQARVHASKRHHR